MIKVKHPDSGCNVAQEAFINSLPDAESKEFHSLLFTFGNAVCHYHDLPVEPTEEDYAEWLEGLPANIKTDMESKGFNGCKTMLPFSRHVRERRDIHLEDFVKKEMGEEIYARYQELVENRH